MKFYLKQLQIGMEQLIWSSLFANLSIPMGLAMNAASTLHTTNKWASVQPVLEEMKRSTADALMVCANQIQTSSLISRRIARQDFFILTRSHLTFLLQTMMSIPVMTLLRYSSLSPDTKTTSLLMYDTTHNPPLPLPIKVGDADLDGFPDILFISVTPDDARVPKLAWSVGCTVNEPGCPPPQIQVERDDLAPSKAVKSDAGVGGRGFVIASSGGDASVLATFRDARSVSFLDLDEDGTLDILIQRSGTGTGGKGIGNGQKINFVQNNVFHDAFFMKAIGAYSSPRATCSYKNTVLNGACGGMCTPKDPHQGAYHVSLLVRCFSSLNLLPSHSAFRTLVQPLNTPFWTPLANAQQLRFRSFPKHHITRFKPHIASSV